jgi:restriction endonuclease Mrr
LHADGEGHVAKDVVAAMAEKFWLTREERAQMIPSGKQTKIANRSRGRVHTWLRQAPWYGRGVP